MFIWTKSPGRRGPVRFLPGCLVWSLVLSLALTLVLNVVLRVF